MTAWDMVSIAIFDLTFNVAFYLLLGGGLMAGLLFLVWVTKQAVSQKNPVDFSYNMSKNGKYRHTD